MAKKNALLGELVETMEERNITINVLRKRDFELEIPHGGDIVLPHSRYSTLPALSKQHF